MSVEIQKKTAYLGVFNELNTLSVKRVTEISSSFVGISQFYHYPCCMLSFVKAYTETSVSVKERRKKKKSQKKSDSYNTHSSLSLKEIGAIHLSVHVHIDMPLILTVFKTLLSMHRNLGLCD